MEIENDSIKLEISFKKSNIQNQDEKRKKWMIIISHIDFQISLNKIQKHFGILKGTASKII